MIRAFQKVYSAVPSWAFKALVIGIGLLLLIFNDEIGKANTELFVLLMVSYFFLLLFILVGWTFKQVRSTLLLRKEKTRIEALHLQSQVSPHFFFNVLNNLYGWIDKDPSIAQEIILNLSEMMRYSIYDGQNETVTIQEEIEYLNKYISLHKNRYLKEINITSNIEIQNPNKRITPLLFIILLENAFKHGVESLRDNSFVDIEIKSTADQLHFSIRNNFSVDSMKNESGIGIKNLKRRLEIKYPKAHKLNFHVSEDIYNVDLTIPLI